MQWTLSVLLCAAAAMAATCVQPSGQCPSMQACDLPGYVCAGNGYYGEYGCQHTVCPEGTAVCGADVRIQPYQGSGLSTTADDSAFNGMRLHCCPLPEYAGLIAKTVVTVAEGKWGDWSTVMCPTNHFVKGVELQIEAPQGSGDDTALNAMTL